MNIAMKASMMKMPMKTDYEKQVNEALSAVIGYKEYTEKNGMHFTTSLAEHASKAMKNRNGMYHTWTEREVKETFEKLGYIKPSGYTWGDATYAANMAYADFYGSSIKIETDCLKYAHDLMSDPDGYDCMILNRYLADIMGKKETMDWRPFM